MRAGADHRRRPVQASHDDTVILRNDDDTVHDRNPE